MFTQKVFRVMAPVIKNLLLNEIKNHWGGKCLAVPRAGKGATWLLVMQGWVPSTTRTSPPWVVIGRLRNITGPVFPKKL